MRKDFEKILHEDYVSFGLFPDLTGTGLTQSILAIARDVTLVVVGKVCHAYYKTINASHDYITLPALDRAPEKATGYDFILIFKDNKIQVFKRRPT